LFGSGKAFLAGFIMSLVIFGAVAAMCWLRPQSRAASPDIYQARPRPISERISYNVYFACFVLAPFFGLWLAASRASTYSWEVASLVFGAIWLVWGVVPVSISILRRPSTFASFKTKVEHYSGASFRDLVRVWILGTGAALFSAGRLLLHS
jgi:hypothetical protein